MVRDHRIPEQLADEQHVGVAYLVLQRYEQHGRAALLRQVDAAVTDVLAAGPAAARAAKSIIRFPEINAQKARENGTIGIDDVTEYFLVGSFASWIVALGGLALTQ